MHENDSHHNNSPGHHHGPTHDHQVDLLQRDAALLGAYLDEAADWIGAHVSSPARVVDLGAGTGVGAVALARRFPRAAVTATDVDPRMLELARGAAAAADLAGQVTTRVVDLDAAWPADLVDLDVVWASGSLHHVAEPTRLLADLTDALGATGVLAVIEMDAVPGYLPDPALARRVSDLVTARHPHSYPDWGPVLRRAGYAVLDLRGFTQETAPGAPGVAAYARADLQRVRAALAADLDPADLTAIDRLLDTGGPGSLEELADRGELVARGSRTGWLARPARTTDPTTR